MHSHLGLSRTELLKICDTRLSSLLGLLDMLESLLAADASAIPEVSIYDNRRNKNYTKGQLSKRMRGLGEIHGTTWIN